jgi:hypothetical protein
MQILLNVNAKVGREDIFKPKTEHESLHQGSIDSGVTILTLSLLYMKFLVKPETLTSLYMDLRLAMLKAVSFYLLHNVSTLNQCRKLSCGTVVCKHFAS